MKEIWGTCHQEWKMKSGFVGDGDLVTPGALNVFITHFSGHKFVHTTRKIK